MKLRGISIFKPRARSKRHHPWLIEFGTKDDRTRVTGSTDYADTVKLAERLSVIDQRIRLGMGNPAELRQEIQRRIPITQHLNDYEKAMIAKGKSKKHALQMRLYAEEALESVQLVDQIVSSDVQARVSKRAVSAKTKNRRMYAVMDFLRWGKTDRRWPQSIITGMSLTRLPESQITQRRVLSLHDLARLIHAASIGAAVAGTSGAERALLYRAMIASGLRRGEMLRAQVKHLTTDGIHLPAALTKNRKGARITLPKSLIAQLSAHVAGKPLDDPIFKVTKFNPDRLEAVSKLPQGNE
jgi:integrase